MINVQEAIKFQREGLKDTEIAKLYDVSKQQLSKELNKHKIIKGYTYEIFPNEEQKEIIHKHFDAAKFVYNWGLGEKTKWYNYYKIAKVIEQLEKSGQLSKEEKEAAKQIKKVRKDIYSNKSSMKNLSRRLTHELKPQYDFLQNVGDKPLRYSLRNLDAAFQNFFRRPSKDTYPNYHKRYTSTKTIQFQEGFHTDYEQNKIKVPVIGWIKGNLHRSFDGRIISGSVKYISADHYFVNFQVETNNLIPPKKEIEDLNKIVGIDLNSKDMVFSDGLIIDNPKNLRKSLERLALLQQQLSKKKKGSSNYKKLKVKVAKLHYKISNQRKDFHHKVSRFVVDNYDMICLEDLDIKGMMSKENGGHKKQFSRAISDVAWGEFIRQIKYKAEWDGKTVIQIGRYEPSSQLCSICGYQNKKLTLDDRTWKCPVCETVHDRDLNAAINIRNIGLKELSKSFKYYNENVLFGVMGQVDTASI